MDSKEIGRIPPVCLITGASRGIGRAVAERFGKEGYELILISHREIKDLNDELSGYVSRLAEIDAELVKLGEESHF